MSSLKLLQWMRKTGKQYYTISDISKFLGLEGQALKVRLYRLVKNGDLQRISRGMYAPVDTSLDVEKAANEAVYPSYISFNYALSKYGILSEVPYEMELAVLKSTRTKTIMNTVIKYRKINKNLFFGYRVQGGVLIAEPEKAFLDSIYFSVFGKDPVFIPEKYDIKKLNPQKMMKYLAKYPDKVKKIVNCIKFMEKYGAGKRGWNCK